eukprot:460663-Prorocentrum_minimum.AAC.7
MTTTLPWYCSRLGSAQKGGSDTGPVCTAMRTRGPQNASSPESVALFTELFHRAWCSWIWACKGGREKIRARARQGESGRARGASCGRASGDRSATPSAPVAPGVPTRIGSSCKRCYRVPTEVTGVPGAPGDVRRVYLRRDCRDAPSEQKRTQAWDPEADHIHARPS